jgi:glyoxylate reductase
LPTLKIIANLAVGYDNVDLVAADQRKILVTNTPGVLDETVAEHAFALLIAISRRIAEGDRCVREGRFKIWSPLLLLGTDLNEKTLGVIGAGRIGSKVAYFAHKGFRMKILYHDPQRNERFEKEVGATFIPHLDSLIPQCDFISLHCPLNAHTRHLIDERRLSLMKPSAYLINTARGPIVDESALVKALERKKIKGAALDVFEFEPKVSEGLMRLENVIMTPHTASASESTRSKMAEMAAANIIEALEGRTPPNLVRKS